MKALSGLALIALSLTVAACGKKDEGSVTSAEPIAAVAAPAGTKWSETIAASPDGYFVMGNPNAKVKLVEYGSYTCSHCRDFAAESSEEIRQIVDSGKMSFEFRNYVRDPIDISTALLARCGGKDIFYPLSEQFFANQSAMFEKAQALGDEKYKALMSAPRRSASANWPPPSAWSISPSSAAYPKIRRSSAWPTRLRPKNWPRRSRPPISNIRSKARRPSS